MQNDMIREINAISMSLFRDLEKEITHNLDKCGIFYKIFSRVKSGDSVDKKISDRINQGKKQYKLQDIVGFRIALYFKEDIGICEKIIKDKYKVVDISKDKEEVNEFKPTRINYVCQLPEYCTNNMEEIFENYPIDTTFEIQIRTIFSEGWHEVEHDFRYKCKEDWENNDDLSRTLNGVLATLENCDWVISSLFDDLAYRHYKNKEWDPMIKNKMKIRMTGDSLDVKIIEIFNLYPSVAKKFFRAERHELLTKLSKMGKKIPLTSTNLIYILNEIQIHSKEIDEIVPNLIKEALSNEK